jgi:hypothetical protein
LKKKPNLIIFLVYLNRYKTLLQKTNTRNAILLSWRADLNMNRKAQSVNMIAILLMIFIVAIVGTALIPSIADSTATATASSGIVDTPSQTLLNLNILMYALLIMGSVVGLAFLLMKYIGLV